MWFHRDCRADDWLLFVVSPLFIYLFHNNHQKYPPPPVRRLWCSVLPQIESPSASRGRGFVTGRMFNRKGEVWRPPPPRSLTAHLLWTSSMRPEVFSVLCSFDVACGVPDPRGPHPEDCAAKSSPSLEAVAVSRGGNRFCNHHGATNYSRRKKRIYIYIYKNG